MITKKYLEQLVASWPDGEGCSSNPEVYNEWIERERRYNARVIQNAWALIAFSRFLKNKKRC